MPAWQPTILDSYRTYVVILTNSIIFRTPRTLLANATRVLQSPTAKTCANARPRICIGMAGLVSTMRGSKHSDLDRLVYKSGSIFAHTPYHRRISYL